MAWNDINGINWQYSDTPEIDNPINEHNYIGKHTSGIRTNNDGTEIYLYCKQLNKVNGIGYGELNKTYIDYYYSEITAVTHNGEIVTHNGEIVTHILGV